LQVAVNNSFRDETSSAASSRSLSGRCEACPRYDNALPWSPEYSTKKVLKIMATLPLAPRERVPIPITALRCKVLERAARKKPNA
jgi:hypothetical protein